MAALVVTFYFWKQFQQECVGK